jgi:hypothetical protein
MVMAATRLLAGTAMQHPPKQTGAHFRSVASEIQHREHQSIERDQADHQRTEHSHGFSPDKETPQDARSSRQGIVNVT